MYLLIFDMAAFLGEGESSLRADGSEKEKWVRRRERKERRDSERRGSVNSSDSDSGKEFLAKTLTIKRGRNECNEIASVKRGKMNPYQASVCNIMFVGLICCRF